MSDPNRNPLKKQISKTSLEQSLKMISPPQQAPITIYPGPSSGLANLSKADLEIAQRLENLRKSHSETLPTEEEMASRLAHLKGLPSDHYSKSNATADAYQRPDIRTQGQMTEDLLKQAMEEVSLDARAPRPEDEFEARLARLRGEEPRGDQIQGAVALPPGRYHNHSHTGAETALGEDLDDITMDDVEALMQEAEKENSAAEKAMTGLQADPVLAQAVAQATRKKEKKTRQKKSRGGAEGNGDTSDEERQSLESDIEIEGGKAIDAVTEQEEVQRIIDMYTKRAQLKKEKKRKKREAAAAAEGEGAVGGAEDSDSDIEVSSESDLSSDSEKFSATDELTD
ncbi:hypothetical protein SK128_003329 [Halocaridina rubra]|uniref:Uncharacterized protein n=1 Tax=Halocaridina rubra TaxID=373956 RepID=A0AAN8X7X1_HALRR